MSQQAERRVGTIIGGKWRVDALLGSGSMAAVYAVTHRNGARAALKILHPTLCTDPAVCERFLGEGYLANSVKHSGIVRVLDDGVTDDGCVFLTMDLLEGDTLESLRQKRGNKIPIPEALDLADKLMDVLSAVHAVGIIHRDLKPQNVFVCDDGVLKLLDFGVARVFDRASQSALSMFGLVLGTPSFMSPEQALGSRDKVDHRSDIWSFGATMFTALAGETVHLGASVQAKLLAAATVKARSIAMVMPSLPPGIAAAIDMALRFKKEDRWQSVDVMRRAFRDAREAAGLGPAVEPSRPFDMSLDEATHRDTGGPAALAALPAAAFDVAPAVARRSSRPPPLPARARITPSAGVANDMIRRLPTPDPMAIHSSRPDGRDREGSIPAYGNTLNVGAGDSARDVGRRDLAVPPKSSAGAWMMAVLLAAAALGGISFLAVKRGNALPDHATGAQRDPGNPATAVPSATVPPPEPTSMLASTGERGVIPPSAPTVETSSGTVVVGKDAATGTPAPPAVTPTTTARAAAGGSPWRANNTGAGGHAPRNPGRPAATPNNDSASSPPSAPTTRPTESPKPAPSGLAPDPFGTPD